jgi:cytochrome b561
MKPDPTPSLSSAPNRHPALTIGLHWVSALAVLAAFAVAWTRAALDDPQPRATLMTVHQSLGLLLLALLLARVATRIATWSAGPRIDLPRPMQIAAFGTHVALYGALLAMPLLGWSLANAQGHDVRLPGLAALPALAAADPDLADALESWHVGLSWTLLALVALHVLAALFHHFVRRDGVLRSMLPRVPKRTRAAVRLRGAPAPQDSRSW